MAAIKDYNKLFLAFMMIVFIKGSVATNHIVGDLNGCSTEIGLEATISTLATPSSSSMTHEDFVGCNPTSPIETYATGNDEVVLDRVGHHYFISGNPSHCQAGLRVDVFVDPAAYPIPPASSP
ncbi:early nodulin-like protein 14 [Rutidosis leptorrhynchoides]|uniref:early nodulin-like protein 14 n=1 Tax=Rutidosis leptorrhynchoides TaxID=125765 RepID=UPI003A9A3490